MLRTCHAIHLPIGDGVLSNSSPPISPMAVEGHLKTASSGHLKAGQLSASRTTCFSPPCDLSGKFFGGARSLLKRAARFILPPPGRGVRQRGEAPGAPPQRRKGGGGPSRTKETSHSGGKAVNPR